VECARDRSLYVADGNHIQRVSSPQSASPESTVHYQDSANGELAEKLDPATGTRRTYEYDELGNLMAGLLSDGTLVESDFDGGNRRIGRKANGILVQGWLFNGTTPLAEMDGNNHVVVRFVPGGMIGDGLM
jgi:YD repeat-containing protein